MNNLSWFSNQLNITTVIAVAGFIISCATVIYQAVSKRKRLRVRVLSYDAYKNVMYLTMLFENLSQLPVSITNILYIEEGEEFNCTSIPVKISESTERCGSEIIERRISYSEKMPIQLEPLGAASGIILFEKMPARLKNVPKSLTFLICTNRGKAIQKTLELSPDILNLCKMN